MAKDSADLADRAVGKDADEAKNRVQAKQGTAHSGQKTDLAASTEVYKKPGQDEPEPVLKESGLKERGEAPGKAEEEVREDVAPNLVDFGVDIMEVTIGQGLEFMEGTRKIVSRNVRGAAIGLDSFLSGADAEELVNGSYVKIDVTETLEKAGNNYAKQKVKLKLDLPTTEQRLKFVFESDAEDTDSLEEQNRELPSEEVRITDESSSTGALRFLLAEKLNWRINLDAGVRNNPIDPFIRLNARRKTALDEQWRMRFKQSFYYFDDDGFGETSRLYFERAITESYFFRNKMEAQYQDEDNRFEFAEVLSTHHLIDDRHSIDYAIGILGESQPVPRTTSYFIRTSYRYRLYRNWIFLTLMPDISFPRSEGFELYPSFTARLQFILSSDQDSPGY